MRLTMRDNGMLIAARVFIACGTRAEYFFKYVRPSLRRVSALKKKKKNIERVRCERCHRSRVRYRSSDDRSRIAIAAYRLILRHLTIYLLSSGENASHRRFPVMALSYNGDARRLFLLKAPRGILTRSIIMPCTRLLSQNFPCSVLRTNGISPPPARETGKSRGSKTREFSGLIGTFLWLRFSADAAP